MPEGYCMKCKKKREMSNYNEVVKKKRKIAFGICSECGTKMSKILGKE